MKARTLLGVVALGAALSAGTAGATTLFVQWYDTSPYQATITGVGTVSFGLGWAEGWLNGTPTTGTYLGQVFCVDLLNYSGDAPWDVTIHNDATSFDSNDGDMNDTLEEDEFRDAPNGLFRAAYLANKFRSEAWQDKERSVGLQFAMYTQMYGSRLTSMSGLNSNEQSYYNQYIADINSAVDPLDERVTWYDNDNIQMDRYQDFMRPIPEPTSLGILGLGLLGFGLLRRRRS